MDTYSARLEAYVAGADPREIQRQTVATLTGLLSGVSEEELSRSPAPGKWSVRSILAHLAEDELVTSWRYRQMIENPGVVLAGFDQDLWARLGDYQSWTVKTGLDMFRLLREANLALLGRLTPEQWLCHGIHAERGQITVADLARHMAGHDCNHVEQVRALLDSTRPG